MSRIAFASILCLAAGGALAAEPTSAYTKINLKKCKTLDQSDQGGTWRCKGLKGYALYVAEGDLRMMIGYGKGHEKQRAASQTLGPFNSLVEKDGITTLEWRLAGGVPYATIVSYQTQSDASGTMVTGQVLVVSKVGAKGGSDACHVAHIDALANADANVLARKAADEMAAKFDCAKDPVVVGKTGKSPM